VKACDEYACNRMDLKYFKHKGAMIGNYLLPEQIVSKLNQIKQFQFESNDCICASFPKSGTTLIQEIVYLIQSDFDYDSVKNIDISERYAFIEWPSVQLNKLSQNSNEKTRFFKTHLPPESFNQSFQKAKVS
jgi:sulfotransferase 4A1